MNKNPKKGAMHQSPVESFYKMFFCFWLLFEQNVIVPENCIRENNKRIGEEDQDREEKIEYFPVKVVILPVKLKATYFLPKVVLIVRMTDKKFVVVP